MKMRRRKTIRDEEEASSRLAPKGDDGRFDFCVAMNGCSDWLYLERPGRRLK